MGGKGFTWSPSVLERDDRFVLDYVVCHRESGLQSISMATGDRPEGPSGTSAGYEGALYTAGRLRELRTVSSTLATSVQSLGGEGEAPLRR